MFAVYNIFQNLSVIISPHLNLPLHLPPACETSCIHSYLWQLTSASTPKHH